MIVNKINCCIAVLKSNILQYVFKKRGIGFYASYSKFFERPQQPATCFRKSAACGGNFHQQRIKERGDIDTGVRTTFIEPDTMPTGISISYQCAVIRFEIVCWVFGSNPALYGNA